MCEGDDDTQRGREGKKGVSRGVFLYVPKCRDREARFPLCLVMTVPGHDSTRDRDRL